MFDRFKSGLAIIGLLMRFVLLIIGLCLILGGCNADPRYRRETALLRAELVDLEDKYFALRSQRDAAIDALHSQGKGNEAEKIMRRSPNDPVTTDTLFFGVPVLCQDDVCFGDSTIEAPSYRHQDSRHQDFQSDEVSSHSGGVPRPVGDAGSIRQVASERSGSGSGRGTVVAIELNDQASFERDDSLTGAPGVQVLLQPFDGQGQLLLDAGSLEVSLIDPYRSTVSQRIGFWKFLPEELELFADEAELGFLLHLPYQDSFPAGDEVEVVIRYRPASGQTLRTSHKIKVGTADRENSEIRVDHQDDDLITRVNKRQTGAVGATEKDRPTWRPIR